ncbi:hypothetical protein FF1_033282 [Malus domestica]
MWGRGPLQLRPKFGESSPSGGQPSNPIVQGIYGDPSPNPEISNMAIPCEVEMAQGKPNIFEGMGLKRSNDKNLHLIGDALTFPKM